MLRLFLQPSKSPIRTLSISRIVIGPQSSYLIGLLPPITVNQYRCYCDPPKGWENYPKPSSKWKQSEDSEKNSKSEKDKEKDKKEEDPNDGTDPSTNDNGIWPLLIIITAFVTIVIYFTRETAKEISFATFQSDLLPYGFVDHLEVVNQKKVRVYNKISITPEYYFTISNVKDFEHLLGESLRVLGIPEQYLPIKYKSEINIGVETIHLVPIMLSFGLLLYVFKSLYSRAKVAGQGPGGGIFSIGKSTAKLAHKSKIKVTFKDVAGCEEAKQEITEFVSFLKEPARYTALGAKIPKGALLVGPPGTGKTLLAKATAGEASVPFYSVSGSDFIEIFGGVGPARVRDLFSQARRNAPCIIFLDEIDAIGRKRGGYGRNDERENTLNQLLVEMDGFESNKGIVVLAGTNRPDILDRALLRPGRFDRQIAIDLPDIKSREAIFKVHLAALKLDTALKGDEYATKLAALTPGFSGADVANVCNEAALIAARFNLKAVRLVEFEAAIDRVVAGLEKKSLVLSPQEKEIVAYHEAGHALVGWLLPHMDPLLKVTIIPRGRATLGFSQHLNPEEHYLQSHEHLLDMMTTLLAGRAAEEVKFGEISSGAQDDLQKVTQLAYSQIIHYGMSSKFGLLSFSERNNQGYSGKPFSESTSEMVDSEVFKMISNSYNRSKHIIQQNLEKLEEIAQHLLAKEVLHSDEIKKILGEKVCEDKTIYTNITQTPGDVAQKEN